MSCLLLWAGNKFKFQVQDSDSEYLIWRFEEHITLSEKKTPLLSVCKVALEKKLLAGLQTENCKFNEAQARSAVTLTHTLLLEN